MSRRFLLAVGVTAALAGCGSAHPTSDRDQIRDVAALVYGALTSNHPEGACKYALKEKDCLRGLGTVKALHISLKDLIPDDWRTRIATAPVYVDKRRNAASLQITSRQKNVKTFEKVNFRKVNGSWLVVENTSNNG